MDCSLPGSSVHGILQARILEWVAISSPGDILDPGIEQVSPALAGKFFTTTHPRSHNDGAQIETQEIWSKSSVHSAEPALGKGGISNAQLNLARFIAVSQSKPTESQ